MRDLRGACHGESGAGGAVGIDPSAFPQSQLGNVRVVHAVQAVCGQRGECGLEMCPRRFEGPTPDVKAGSVHERQAREARGGVAQRGRGQSVGLRPIPDREQSFDRVRQKHGAVDAVPVNDIEASQPDTRRLGRAAEHGEGISEVEVRPVQAPVIADVLGEP
jgi:hypothetical protein